MLTGMLDMMSLISSFNMELLAWGRGLEALANGKLHPALTNHGKVRHAISAIDGKAKAIRRRILHDDKNGAFRASVSYLTTEDGRIIFIVHVPLVVQEPMELFEYLPTLVKIGSIYLEVTETDRILALDSRGQKGLEMSRKDLLRCQTEERHNGQIFVCGTRT